MDGDNKVFDGDIASRYAERREPMPIRSWRDNETQITKEISASPTETVASFIWNFNRSYENNLTSLIRARKFAEARSYYDGIRKTIEDNRDQIGILTQIGDAGGTNATELAERAQYIYQYKFDDWEVDMTDGSKATVGQVLSDDSPYLAMKTRDLNGYGFSGLASGMYMYGSDTQKFVLGSIIDPFVRQTQNGKNMIGAGVVPNHRQMADLANDISKNWDVLNGVFGDDGIGKVVDFVRDSHSQSGNMTATLRALAQFADNYRDGSMSGSDLATTAISGYEDLLTSTMGGDAAKSGKAPEFTDEQRRRFDAIALPAVKELSSRIGRFDFNDPRLRTSMLEVADTDAWLTSIGVNQIKDARRTGRSINDDFAKYVADRVTNENPSASNIVTAMRGLRSFLDQNVTGARDAETVRVQMTGNSRDYLTSVDKANGTRSSSRTSDAVVLDSKAYIARNLAPLMVGGVRADDALRYVLDDPDRRSDFMSGLTETFMNHFHGSRYAVAENSKVMADALIASLSGRTYADGSRAPSSFCFQDVVENMMNDPSGGLSQEAQRSLASWYHGNFTAQEAFGPMLAIAESHLKDQGFTDSMVRREIGLTAQRMSVALQNGKSPKSVVDELTGVGMALIPHYSKDENGKVFLSSIERQPSRLNNVEFDYLDESGTMYHVTPGTYSKDRSGWDAIQSVLRERKKVLDAARVRDESQTRSDASFERRLKLREEARAAREDSQF